MRILIDKQIETAGMASWSRTKPTETLWRPTIAETSAAKRPTQLLSMEHPLDSNIVEQMPMQKSWNELKPVDNRRGSWKQAAEHAEL